MGTYRRNITHKLILTLIIVCLSISPIFASTPEIEIEHNDNEYFHAYNSNSNVANSYIDSGASVFSKAMNYMFMNIAKSTSTVYSIQGISNNIYSKLSNSDTTLSNIATEIGLIKQSNVAQSNSLSSILSNSNTQTSYISQIAGTLGYQTTGNLYDIKDSLTKINWDYNYNGTFYDSSFNTMSSDVTIGPNDTYYFVFNTSTWGQYSYQSLYKIVLPIYPNSRIRTNNYYVKFYNNNSSNRLIEVSTDYISIYNSSDRTLEIYLTNPYLDNDNLYVQVIPETSNDSYYVYLSFGIRAYSMSSNNPDYYPVTNFMFNKLNYYQMNKLVDNGISFDDSNIVDAINNLSLQDNDVKLNLTINNNTGSDGTDIISRLQNFFNTGVSVGDFFDNVDDAESGWFTQSNSDVINTLRGGYTNFYE